MKLMALNQDLSLFQQAPLLRLLEPDALRLLVFSAERRKLRKGDVVTEKGRISQGGALLAQGALSVLGERAPKDARSESVRILYPPTLVGEMALMTQTEQIATIAAREPSAIFYISRLLFLKVLAEFPASAAALQNEVAARLLRLSENINETQRRMGLALDGNGAVLTAYDEEPLRPTWQ